VEQRSDREQPERSPGFLKLPPYGLAARIVIAILTSAGILYASLAPVIATGLAQHPDFTSETGGYVFSANMYGSAIGGFIIIFLVEKLAWRSTSVLLLILLIGADVLSVLVTEPALMYVVRFLHGLAGGGLIGVGMALIARTPGPERTFALLIVIQLTLGGVVTAALTPYLPDLGVAPLWWFLAAFSTLALILLPLLGEYPIVRPEAAMEGTAARAPMLAIALVLGAVFFFQAGEMAAFVYVIELGSSYRLDIEFVSLVVALGLWLGGPSALIVNWWSTRSGRLIPTCSGLVLTIVSVGLLLVPDATTFLLANVGFGIFFSITIPYLLGIASEMDNTGQMSALGGFVNSLGLATGPAIAAYLVGDGNLHLVVMFAVVAIVVSLTLVVPPARLLDRKSRHGRAVW
jgi:MFS family permease